MAKNNIEKIIFYSNKGEADYKEAAYIIYNNNKGEFLTKEEALELLPKLLKSNNTTTLESLIKLNKVIFVHQNQLDEYIIEEKEESIDEEVEEEENVIIKDKKTYKKAKLCAKILAIAIPIATVGILAKSCADKLNKSPNYNIENNNTNLEETDNNIYNILNRNINENKKQFITNTLDYLKYYNNDFSTLYSEVGKNTNLAHTWDEVVVQQLIYNNYNKDELIQIFDTYNFSADELFAAYIYSTKQDMQAHIVQNFALDKEKLIKKEKGKEFYSKYQSLLIKFNFQKNIDEKQRIARQFYDNVKNDFNINTFDNKETYKLSVIPMIKAMNKMCKNLNVESTLNKDDIKEFDKIVYTKLQKLEEKIKSSYYTTSNILEQETSYEQCKNSAIDYLISQNLYNIDDNQRDISNHDAYKTNINYKNNKENTIVNENNNNNSNNNKTNNNDNKDNTKKKPKKKRKNKLSIDVKPTPSPTVTPTETPDINDFDDEEPTNVPEMNNDNDYDLIIDDIPNDDVFIDNNTPNNNTNNNDNDNNNNNNNGNDNNNNNNNIIIEDNSYQNDDSIINITTDPTGAVEPDEPLPNPNEVDSYYTYSIEDYAEYIINDMENNPENYQNSERNSKIK